MIIHVEPETCNKNLLIFKNKYLKMKKYLKLYKCIILNSIFKNI
jgi:hypothetical protein